MSTNSDTAAIPPILVEPGEWEQLASILKAHLAGRSVWAFGSRATGRQVKRFSDLDLLIGSPQMTLLESALLREAFDESRLPFKVDIVQTESLKPEFQRHIEAEKVLLMHGNR